MVAGADAIVTICNGLKQDLVARGNDPARITIMPNGVIWRCSAPAPRDENLARELGLQGAR
jgi:hypothetical protein